MTNTNGLTIEDIKTQLEILTKANDLQLEQIINEIKRELKRRNDKNKEVKN